MSHRPQLKSALCTLCLLFFKCPVLKRPDLARTEFLSDPDERLNWQSKSLPSDDLCTENAIMLKRFNRLVVEMG